jgi:hypothetical protein
LFLEEGILFGPGLLDLTYQCNVKKTTPSPGNQRKV